MSELEEVTKDLHSILSQISYYGPKEKLLNQAFARKTESLNQTGPVRMRTLVGSATLQTAKFESDSGIQYVDYINSGFYFYFGITEIGVDANRHISFQNDGRYGLNLFLLMKVIRKETC